MQNIRYGWMIIRLCLPAIGFAGLAMLCEVLVRSFGGHSILTSFAKALNVVEALLVLATAAAVAVAMYCYWRWERGDSPDCMRCGGLLGRERSGRWGRYRKCLACGQNERAKTYV
jgi:hypothetical protein